MQKHIESLDAMIDARKRGNNSGNMSVNATLMRAYGNSLELGCDTINFEGVIWEEDVDPIVDTLRENGFGHFTTTSTFSELFAILALFEKRGCKVEGMTECLVLPERWQSVDGWYSGDAVIKPAIRIAL